MRKVELEQVTYRTGEISAASTFFIYCFAKYSGIFGTEQWVKSLVNLLEIIKEEKPKGLVLSAEGLEITFSGFPPPNPKIRGERVVFAAREPQFIVQDRFTDLLPSGRTHVLKITDAIAEEMQKVYRLRRDSDPERLIFPKEEYGRNITVTEGVLLA